MSGRRKGKRDETYHQDRNVVKFIEQVFQGSKEMRQIEGQLLGKIRPWEVMCKGACLPELDSSTDLAFSCTHEVESPIAFPGEKIEELETEHIEC